MSENSAPDRKDHADVLVVGGGMVGLTLGCALAGSGLSVILVDRQAVAAQAEAGYDGRASAISLGSAQVFRGIGLWPFLEDHAEPILDIRVADGHPLRGVSPLFLHYDHRVLEPETGGAPFGHIIENRVIRAGLLRLAGRLPDLRIVAPAAVTALRQDAAHAVLTLEGGRHLRGRVVIAADGAASPLRAMAGIRAVTHAYRQTGLVCTVEHARDHCGTAVELFLPGGPFAMLPMTGRRSNIVWSEANELAQQFLALDDDAFLAELRSRFGGWLGEIRLAGPRFAYPLRLALAESYTAPRLALAGDAAHVIHPIAGQGYNMGVRDVAALAEALVDAHRLGLDPGGPDVLAAYERRRRFDNTLLAGVCHSLLKLFSNDDPVLRLARGLGLAAVQRALPVKKLLMRHAMGIVGDVPRLVRGDPL